LNAKIILDRRGHLKTDCPALRLQQIDLDQITQAYPKDLSEPGRDRQTAFGQPDWTQIDVDDAPEIGICWSTADQDPTLDATIANADRDLSIGLDRACMATAGGSVATSLSARSAPKDAATRLRAAARRCRSGL